MPSTMIDRSFLLLLMLLAPQVVSQAKRTLVVPQDFETVGAAIEAAAPGDTVEIRPGLYEENITLKSKITLRAKNADKTTVRGAAAEPVVSAFDAEDVRVINLSFEHQKPESDDEDAPAVYITGGEVVLEGCSVRAAAGIGIRIEGGKGHRLLDCSVRESRGDGLRVEDAELVIRKSRFLLNAESGIHARTKGRLEGKDIRCEGNKTFGIRITGAAMAADLMEVEARANTVGLKIEDAAKATVTKSKFIANHGQGLYALKATLVEVKDTECAANKKGGLLVAESKGTIVKAVCSGNTGPGITIANKATEITVTGSTCNENTSSGIVVARGAHVTVHDTSCDLNEGSGISASGEGTVVKLTDNVCQENERHGLHLSKQASGQLEGNRATKNELSGISILEKAVATLTKNRSLENLHNGIMFGKGGSGSAEANTCDRNQQSGILFHGKGSKATLKRNTCRRNFAYGVNFLAGATAVKVGRDNRLSSNRRGRVGR